MDYAFVLKWQYRFFFLSSKESENNKKSQTSVWYSILKKRTLEKLWSFSCNAGQNVNCNQIICEIVLIAEPPQVMLGILSLLDKNFREKKILFIFDILRMFTWQRRRWRIAWKYYIWWFLYTGCKKACYKI